MISGNDKGQIYTMEGITAALIILGVLLFVIEANSLVVPQTERSVDMKLGELASDVLTTLDWNSNDSWSTTGALQAYVAGWDGQKVSYSSNTPDPGLAPMSSNITAMLLQDSRYRQTDVQYNLEFIYTDKDNKMNTNMVLLNGEPDDNSMVASRLVTLQADDPRLSQYWKDHGQFPQVVQVKIICWHV